MPLENLLHQDRLPVCTGISLLITVAVEFVVLDAGWSLPGSGFGALGIVLSTGLIVAVGVIGNSVAGHFSRKRGEYWGGRIAALGVAIWAVTVAAFYFLQ